MEEEGEGDMEEEGEGAGTRAQSAAQKSPSKCSYTPCEAEDSEEALKDCAACKELKVHHKCQCASVLYRAYNRRCTGGRPRPFPFQTDAFYCGRCQTQLIRKWCATRGGKDYVKVHRKLLEDLKVVL